MKYMELLNVGKNQELNVTKLFVANEVDVLIKEHIKEINEEIFERLCSLVYEYYLMIDYSSINNVANVVCSLYLKKENINEKIVREKLTNLYLWERLFILIPWRNLILLLYRLKKRHDTCWNSRFTREKRLK